MKNVINQSIHQVKLNKKTPFHCKSLIFFADNISSDLAGFKHILCFSKIEGSIIQAHCVMR